MKARSRAHRGGRAKWVIPAALAAFAFALLTAGLLANVNRHEDLTRLPHAVRPVDASSPGSITVALPNLVRPLTVEQAVKENQERPFDAAPDTPPQKFLLKADDSSRDRAIDCLAQAVYYEAATESLDGQRAVAQVVLNRMRHPGFPATVCGVVYQGSDLPTGCQFTFTCDGSLARTPVRALWNVARKVAAEAIGGRVFAAVGHATHYHADYVVPYWADSLLKQVQIGHHIFYRLRGSLGTAAAFSQRYGGAEPLLPTSSSTAEVAAEAAGHAQELLNSGLAAPTPLAADAVGRAAAVVAAAPAKELLLADKGKGQLVIDQTIAPATATVKHKGSDDCAPAGGKQLLPVGPNDLHAGRSDSSC